jgi:hypothetical protein
VYLIRNGLYGMFPVEGILGRGALEDKLPQHASEGQLKAGWCLK